MVEYDVIEEGGIKLGTLKDTNKYSTEARKRIADLDLEFSFRDVGFCKFE